MVSCLFWKKLKFKEIQQEFEKMIYIFSLLLKLGKRIKTLVLDFYFFDRNHPNYLLDLNFLK